MTYDRFDNEQRAFFDHQTRSGTTYELVQRRDQLRSDLAGVDKFGSNRNAALLALNTLIDQINPPPTQDEQFEKTDEHIIQVAQRAFDQGDDAGAQQTLTAGGLDMDTLAPRDGGDDFDQREEACRTQYLDKRRQAIDKLKVSNQWTTTQANDFFDGKRRWQSGGSLDSALRRDTNLNHRFPGDRPIG